MRTFAHVIFFAVLLTGVFVASAKADTLYTYTGDTFTFAQGVYTPGDRVSGSFVLSDSFIPSPGGSYEQLVTSGIVSYCFTDSHQTLTQSNSTGVFYVGLNGGPPDGTSNWWNVDLKTPTGEIVTEDVQHGDYKTFASTGNSTAVILSINGNLYPGGPGTWTLQRVPEGGTTAHFLLAGLTILTPFIGSKRVTRGL